MGFENRDYARTDDRSYSSPGSRMSIIGWIITVNIAVFVVQCVWTRPLTTGDLRDRLPSMRVTEMEDVDFPHVRVSILEDWFALDASKVLRGQIWRLTTYDFLHSTTDGGIPWHLLMNMYVLYLTGRKIVDVYSEREFLLFYLLAGILSGVFFLAWSAAMGEVGRAIGASGAVCAVVVLYAFRWPHDEWLVFYVIPLKAMWAAVLYAALDLYPMLLQLGGHHLGSHIAHSAHIGGMLFGFLYARQRWEFEPMWDGIIHWNPLKRRPKLRIVRDTDEPSHPEFRPRRNEAQLQLRLDELLAKITEQGQASLTESERNELNEASRYFRERR